MSDPSQSPGQLPGGEPPGAPAKRRIGPRLVIGAILLVLLVVFFAENTRSVKMRLIIPQVRAPLFLALLIAAALGALATLIVRWQRGRKNSR